MTSFDDIDVQYARLRSLLQKEPERLRRLLESEIHRSGPEISDLLLESETELNIKLNLAQRIYTFSTTDGLTGFKTRSYFERTMRGELQDQHPLGYLICDIDHFKRYNDRYGHSQGDKAIESVAKAIQEAAHTENIVRYGGEEFSIFVIQYQGSRKALKECGERIRLAVKNAYIPVFSPANLSERITANLSKEDIYLTSEQQDLLLSILQLPPEQAHVNANNMLSTKLLPEERMQQAIAQALRTTTSIGGARRKKKESLNALMDRADNALYAAKLNRDTVIISV